MTIKQLETQIIPKVQELDQSKEGVSELINQFNASVKEAIDAAGINEATEKIAEMREELRVIELNRNIRKMQKSIQSREIKIEPIKTKIEVPKELGEIFVVNPSIQPVKSNKRKKK